jgi:hypothetical protein
MRKLNVLILFVFGAAQMQALNVLAQEPSGNGPGNSGAEILLPIKPPKGRATAVGPYLCGESSVLNRLGTKEFNFSVRCNKNRRIGAKTVRGIGGLLTLGAILEDTPTIYSQARLLSGTLAVSKKGTLIHGNDVLFAFGNPQSCEQSREALQSLQLPRGVRIFSKCEDTGKVYPGCYKKDACKDFVLKTATIVSEKVPDYEMVQQLDEAKNQFDSLETAAMVPSRKEKSVKSETGHTANKSESSSILQAR